MAAKHLIGPLCQSRSMRILIKSKLGKGSMWVLVRWVASIADEATSPQAITSWQGHRDTRGALIITGKKLTMDP